MGEIDFSKIEGKWQERWEKKKVFEVKEDSKKKKYYCLEMFPYPSGSGLHMGHAWNYTIGDILARFKIMQGYNVLHPMGYDALGLPAENAAIQEGTNPADYTKKSIANYIRQQKEIGLSYDWSRVLSTSDPKYYKWDQWIFLKMLEKGLAYQKEAAVNWCPKCNTVLANEQVQNGVCWRHEDTKVEIKQLKQWFLKITDYADELYEEIESLNWPQRTKAMQKNWIGKSHGVEIDFEVQNQKWGIFTTRPDTIYGVTFVVVSAQHPKLETLVTAKQKKEVDKFLKELKSVSEKDLKDVEKSGVFTGSFAINPLTKDKIPVYAGNFVVADYGSGMVMAVPAHDQRDYEFAKKYGLEMRKVITSENVNDRAHSESGKLINSGEFNGLDNEEAKKKITEFLIKKKLARKIVNFKLRDWGIARQRYWGTPIPVIHCLKCGIVGVPEKDLPVELPKEVKFGVGNPLETNEKWLNVKCPKCKGGARREPNTMDTFVNSSWYFMRYCDPHNDKKIFDSSKVGYWCPIDTYIGGSEHACMHLIYARFYTKFLRDLGLIKFGEPAKRLFHQGMLHGEGGEKMSKSKGNVVLPETVSKKYGMDTARFFLCSLASPDKNIDWSDEGIIGSLRFVNRIFEYFISWKNGKDNDAVTNKLNLTIKNVTEYYGNFEYRKATIEIRELFDVIEKNVASKETLVKFLQLLSPICPHITEELYEKIGSKGFISMSEWPTAGKVIVEKENVDLNEKIIENVEEILTKISDAKKIYLYAIPNEAGKIDSKKISKGVGVDVKVFATNDMGKYDPENRSRKALPGRPAVFVE